MTRRLWAKAAGCEAVEYASNGVVVLIHLPRAIRSFRTSSANVCHGQPEDEDVLRADRVTNFDVRTVQTANRQRPVEGKLHIARARGFGAGCGNLLAYLPCGDEHLCQ